MNGLDGLLVNYRSKLNLLRKSVYMDFPQETSFETLAMCNAACWFCPYPGLERKGTKMPDELIAKIISDLRDIPGAIPIYVSPFKVNEPLLDVRIFDIFGELNSKLPNANLRMFTNGSPLNEKNIAKIAKIERLEHLWISLNHHEEKEYERIMQLPLKKTLENLDLLHRTKASGDFAITVQLSKVSEDETIDTEFCRFVAARYPLFKYGVAPRSEWLGVVPNLVSNRKIPLVGCSRWFELSIVATGEASFCCMDGKSEYAIGDVSKSHVLEVYNNPEYRKFRERFVTRLEGSPCMSCTHF